MADHTPSPRPHPLGYTRLTTEHLRRMPPNSLRGNLSAAVLRPDEGPATEVEDMTACAGTAADELPGDRDASVGVQAQRTSVEQLVVEGAQAKAVGEFVRPLE